MNSRRNVIRTLQYFDSQINKAPQWLIYKYAPGKPIQDILLGYPSFFLTKKNLDKIINTFKIIHSLDYHKIKLTKKKYNFYIKEFKKYTKKTPRTFALKRQIIALAEKFLQQNKKTIDQAALVLNHGDLFPQNILKYKNQYRIIDWGESHLNNQAFDLATIYFNAWRNPAWQNNLLKICSLYYGQNFKILFIAAFIRQITMLMNIYGNIYDHPEKWKVHWPYDEKKYYQKIKPIINRAWQAQQQNLQSLLKAVK